MKLLLNVDTTRNADRTAIEKYGISSIQLMENAAKSIADFVITNFSDLKTVNIFCGSGNNGGDGFAVSRMLYSYFKVNIFWIGDLSKMSAETKANYDITQKIEIPTLHISDVNQISNSKFDADIIIDSLIGVGGSENLKGIVVDILKKLNPIKAIKIAVDIPTGLNTNTGFASLFSFRADYTITMISEKIGMYLNSGSDLYGEIIVSDIGAPKSITMNLSKDYIFEESDLKEYFPKRDKRTSKFDYGRVIIVAGSQNFPGAAALTAKACVKIGAGLVELFTPLMHTSLLPEIIFHKANVNENGNMNLSNLELILKRLETSNALVIGPGLGNDTETLELVKMILEKLPPWINVVIDADALRIINNCKINPNRTILTPHNIEFARMFNIKLSDVENNSYFLAKEKAKLLNCIIHLKNVPSIITDGNYTFLNIYGNPGMATGGSGDVLSGIMGGLLAQGLEPLFSSVIGAYIHSKSGDIYASKYNMESLSASDLIDNLKLIKFSE